MAQSQQGDREALETLLRRCESAVFVFLYRLLLGNDADARDLLQQTMMAVTSKILTYQGRSTIETWLRGIAHNKFLTWLREKSARRETSDGNVNADGDESGALSNFPDPGKTPDQILVEKEETAAIHKAISELGEECQKVISLVDLAGLSYEETAGELAWSPKAVSVRLFRCRKKLRPKLDRLEGLFGRNRDRGFAREV